MTDFLDEKRREIDSRLKELKPLVDEYNRLEQAAAALAGVGATSSRSARKPARKRSSSNGGGRRGRPPGSGKRAAQAQEIIAARPGITIPELADAMGIQANYLYRVIPQLEGDGKVRKEGRGWFPAASA